MADDVHVDYSARTIAATERDPRDAPYGYFSGGSFALDSTRVFQWFTTLEDLVQNLLEVEPRIWEVDEEEGAAYVAGATPLLARLKSDGFTDGLRSKVNKLAKDFMVIDWWGQFNEISSGRCDLGKDLVENYLDEENAVNGIPSDQLDEFIEFLQTCRV